MLNVYGIVISALISGSGVWTICTLIHNRLADNTPLPLPAPQEHVLAALHAARELDADDLEALAASLYMPVLTPIQSPASSTEPCCKWCDATRTHRAKALRNPEMHKWINLCAFHFACFHQREAQKGYVVGYCDVIPERIEAIHL